MLDTVNMINDHADAPFSFGKERKNSGRRKKTEKETLNCSRALML